jgi:protein TonB
MRSIHQRPFTPQRAAGLVAALALQAGFVYAIVSGLAGTLIDKLPQVLKVDVQQEKIQPKPPPPPPPQIDIPPPPTAPPPEINIQTEVAPQSITVTKPVPNQPPPPVTHTAVTTPVSVGRAHSCGEKYPEVSMRLNEEGTTTVQLKVNTDGSVSDVTVTKSSGSERLDNAAISCVSRWRYSPATVDGQPVEKTWPAQVVWKLPH